MDFSILGPLEVRADGRSVSLGGTKPRALLAVLLLHPNEPVSAERLALALWGEDATPNATKTIQVYVSAGRLRAPDDAGRPRRGGQDPAGPRVGTRRGGKPSPTGRPSSGSHR